MKRNLLTVVILIVAIAGTVACGSDSSGGSSQAPSAGQTGRTPRVGNAQAGGQPGGAGMPSLSGTVKSISGTTIQVTAQDGSTAHVNVNDQTAFEKRDGASLADVKAGEFVLVSSDQTGAAITARSIQIGLAGQRGTGQGGTPRAGGQGGGRQSRTPGASIQGSQPGNGARTGAAGTVKSVSGDTIVVTEQNDNTVTVTVDDKTTYQKTATGTLADVTAGTLITVMGETSNGTTTARIIQIGGTGQ